MICRWLFVLRDLRYFTIFLWNIQKRRDRKFLHIYFRFKVLGGTKYFTFQVTVLGYVISYVAHYITLERHILFMLPKHTLCASFDLCDNLSYSCATHCYMTPKTIFLIVQQILSWPKSCVHEFWWKWNMKLLLNLPSYFLTKIFTFTH